ncbi:MAG: DNA repair protein RecO [Bacteroidia bacterium]|nr:DNA repair protein RecO [Bacteroidia bacterium]
MLAKTEGFILHNVKYGDASVICKIFTRDFGLQSFIFQGIASGKGKKVTRAHLTPLNLLEIDFYHHPVKNLKRAKEVVCNPILHNLHTVPAKRALGGFIQEVLNRCIAEEEINAALYDLVKETILLIENEEKVPEWLPHLFIIRLCRMLGHGIYADDYAQGKVFSIAEGGFTALLHAKQCLHPDMSHQFAMLLRDKQASLTFRKELLQSLIQFLQYHVIGSKPIQSIEIFSMVMAR